MLCPDAAGCALVRCKADEFDTDIVMKRGLWPTYGMKYKWEIPTSLTMIKILSWDRSIFDEINANGINDKKNFDTSIYYRDIMSMAIVYNVGLSELNITHGLRSKWLFLCIDSACRTICKARQSSGARCVVLPSTTRITTCLSQNGHSALCVYIYLYMSDMHTWFGSSHESLSYSKPRLACHSIVWSSVCAPWNKRCTLYC